MTVTKQAFKGGIWLASFTAIGQTVSWAVTFLVARILVPADYGLMDMATILTGYVHIFYELGLGAAIIQRKDVSDDELSSIFWMTVVWGALLAVVCLALAGPTVAVFNEPRVYSITQTVSILFLLSPMFIVPRNVLYRKLRFKAIGALQSAAVIVASLSMLVLANHGFGVWTLIYGHIIREAVQLFLSFFICHWKPRLHFRLSEILPYISFGLPVIAGSSLMYITLRADVFFGGRMLPAEILGFYSFAFMMAIIPKNKLLSIIKGVSFPVLSRYQNQPQEFNTFYLQVINMIAFCMTPVYIGGIFVAEDMIPVVLGDKWSLSIVPFKLLCMGYLAETILSLNNTANMAQGRPKWGFCFSAINLPIMVFAFYLCAKTENINMLALPWAMIYPALSLAYCFITLRKIGIPVTHFLRALKQPFLATTGMVGILWLFRTQTFNPASPMLGQTAYLLCAIALGAGFYAFYIWMFQRQMLRSMYRLWKS